MLIRFEAMAGVKAYPSAANFILLKTPEGCADDWHAKLKEKGVLIKNLNGSHPVLQDCLRPTVGTPEENNAMLAVFEALAEAPV